MNYIEKKYELLNRLNPEEFNTQSIFAFEIAGVRINLKYAGLSLERVQNFLKIYFNHFKLLPTDENNFDVIVNYLHSNEQEFSSEKWIGWNEWTHEIELLNFEKYLGIMQRDFVAKISKDFKNVFAIGPAWSFETCDSIDNIISYVIGRHIIDKAGLVLHAACIVNNKNEAMVFFGRSGAGKSTIAEHSYKTYHFKVISSDQVLLKYENGELFAIVVPTTIPEFPLNHPAREKKPIKIKSIVHLVQSDQSFSWKQLSDSEFIYHFMRELVYRNEFGNEKVLLDLSLKISSDKGIIKGEMSYSKGSDYFNKLSEVLNG